MVRSNSVTITILGKIAPEITGNQITVDKTTGYVGDTFNFTGTLSFANPVSGYEVKIDIYINETLRDSITITTDGTSRQKYRFSWSFPEPGTYSVYTDANFTYVGVPTPPYIMPY